MKSSVKATTYEIDNLEKDIFSKLFYKENTPLIDNKTFSLSFGLDGCLKIKKIENIRDGDFGNSALENLISSIEKTFELKNDIDFKAIDLDYFVASFSIKFSVEASQKIISISMPKLANSDTKQNDSKQTTINSSTPSMVVTNIDVKDVKSNHPNNLFDNKKDVDQLRRMLTAEEFKQTPIKELLEISVEQRMHFITNIQESRAQSYNSNTTNQLSFDPISNLFLEGFNALLKRNILVKDFLSLAKDKQRFFAIENNSLTLKLIDKNNINLSDLIKWSKEDLANFYLWIQSDTNRLLAVSLSTVENLVEDYLNSTKKPLAPGGL